jgi:hypothetical protein
VDDPLDILLNNSGINIDDYVAGFEVASTGAEATILVREDLK